MSETASEREARHNLYERARRHGLSHEQALDVLAAGELRCWCGNPRVCEGGAQRLIGCPWNWRAPTREASAVPLANDAGSP